MESVLNLFMQLYNISWKDQAWGRQQLGKRGESRVHAHSLVR